MASYYVWSAAAGSGNGSSWANAFTTLTLAFATEVAGDTLYVAHDHAESSASALTLTSSGTINNPTKIICVNRAGTVPPVSADRRTTATVTTTGIVNITMVGCAHYDGIIFSAGTGSSSSANIICLNANSTWVRFDNCSMRFPITGSTGGSFYPGGSAGTLLAVLVELNNTTVSFSATNTTNACIQATGIFRWRNTPSALLSMVPTTVLGPNTAASQRATLIELVGVDLSAAGSGKTICNSSTTPQVVAYRLIDCKLHASVTKAATPLVGPDGMAVDFLRSGSAGNYAVASYRYAGALTEETTIVRSGGATDGTTPIAWKVITTSAANYSLPYECPPIAIWNDTTGSAKTATIECIAAAIMTDQECWVDLEYLGDASSPQGSFVNDGKADLLATAANQTTSSATWGGSTTAFKLNVTFTAQQKGWIYARVKVGKASSTVYVDPLITLT